MAGEIILPKGVALISDGNRRWADSHGLPHEAGHERGFEAVTEILKETRDLGIKKLIAWGLSTDNQEKRSRKERFHLYHIFEDAIEVHLQDAIENETKLLHIGREDRLPRSLIKRIHEAVEKTSGFDKYTFALALDYGGRDELDQAPIAFAEAVLEDPSLLGRAKADNKTERKQRENIVRKFYQTGFIADDIDLIIRTGGDERLSGFLPLSAQAEFIVIEEFLPDFTRKEYRRICTEEFPARQRRHGR